MSRSYGTLRIKYYEAKKYAKDHKVVAGVAGVTIAGLAIGAPAFAFTVAGLGVAGTKIGVHVKRYRVTNDKSAAEEAHKHNLIEKCKGKQTYLSELRRLSKEMDVLLVRRQEETSKALVEHIPKRLQEKVRNDSSAESRQTRSDSEESEDPSGSEVDSDSEEGDDRPPAPPLPAIEYTTTQSNKSPPPIPPRSYRNEQGDNRQVTPQFNSMVSSTKQNVTTQPNTVHNASNKVLNVTNSGLW